MGRELRRVPMNFDYPQGKVWEGYLNPNYVKCAHCDGKGHTPAFERLEDIVRLLMISGSDAREGKNHPYFDWMRTYVNGFDAIPSPDLTELTVGLAGRDLGHMHDSSDNWFATKKIIEAAGLNPEKWGICQHCKGEGLDPAHKEAYEAWTETPPPTGDGFQLWETTSEGSPSSPVFNTLDKLCEWCETNATTFGRSKTSKENWMKMLSAGLVYHQSGNNIFM